MALADLERAQREECNALYDWNMKLNTKRTVALQRWAFVSVAIYCCVGGWIGNGGSGCRLSMDARTMCSWRWLRWALGWKQQQRMLLGAADDGRGCPEEVAAISKRWSGGQVMRGRAAFISWLNSRERFFDESAGRGEPPSPLVLSNKRLM